MSIKRRLEIELQNARSALPDEHKLKLDKAWTLAALLQEPPTVRPASDHPDKIVILWLKSKATQYEKEGKPFWVRAEYVGKCEREDEGDDEDFSVYNEDDPEDETPYWPEGWYEVAFIRDEYSHLMVNIDEYELLGWIPVEPPQFTEQGHD